MTISPSRSPERHSFQKESHIKRAQEEGQEVSPEYLKMWNDIQAQRLEKEQDPEWQQDNLEWDLRTCDWMLEKVRNSEVYAQNLYAAMCNRDFIKNDVLPVLKNQRWGCSWRYAGGIVADMRGEGDYMDWYCSGIRGDNALLDDEAYQALAKEQQEYYLRSKLFVSESVVTDEIRDDLHRLGWQVVDWEDDQNS